VIVRTNDDFQLGGVAAGVSLAFHAALHGVFYFQKDYSFTTIQVSLLMNEGGASQAEAIHDPGPYSGGFPYDTTLVIPIVAMAGTPFRIHCEAYANGLEAYGGVLGTLSFVDLPPGAFVTSCQGFRQDAPILTRPTTWGRLKASYR
jgi:hypothetical protein